MTDDKATLAFYAAHAASYAARSQTPSSRLDAFLDEVPRNALILDLGCGGGRDTARMLARGFEAVPVDGSPELAAEAERRLGRPVQVMLFDELTATAAYDGVWASASLLHVPFAFLPATLARIQRALRPGGLFWASYKAGSGEGRDKFGRYYNRPDAKALAAAYAQAADWTSLDISSAEGGGYDGVPTTWLWAMARR